MRLKLAALFVLLFSTGAIGQEEPLPVVAPRPQAQPELLLVALPVEPMRDLRFPTLAEAARANDYSAFDALYREAKQNGTSVSPFDTLHEIWTYSVTDPIGAFYGPELYERLVRAYPGFAQYIDEYRVVDDNGNVFYPTSETRAFVLERALEGGVAPRILVAAAPAEETVPAPVVRPARRESEQRRDTSATAAAAPSKKESPKPVRKAATPTVEPVVISAADTTAGNAIAAAVETRSVVAEVAAAVQEAPVASTPVATQAAAPAAEAPVDTPATVVATPAIAPPAPDAARAASQQPDPDSRGLLLIVVGIMGAGLLAVMLRTPRETVPAVVVPQEAKTAEEPEQPAAPVEPLRHRGARGESNRASGSRG